jgi:hypothetical protein
MRGCLFTLLIGAVAIALLVTIGLPAVAAGLLTGAVTAAGLQADDTTVTVSSDPPTDLLALHADRVRVRATHATFRGYPIGALDVTLTDVDLPARTAAGVTGRLSDVTLPNVDAREVTLASITLAGGGDAISATTTVPSADVTSLVADRIEHELGVRPSSVALTAPDRLQVVEAGLTIHGRFVVTATGDLVLRVLDGPAADQELVLLVGGEDLPIHLSMVRVVDAGLRLGGDLTVGLLG